MKAFKGAATFLLLLSLAALPASATCWELSFKVMNEAGDTVSIPVTAKYRDGGGLVKTVDSLSVDDYNFFIDVNTASCDPPGVINLKVDTEYVLEFHYPESSGGTKSVCFYRGECPRGTFDTFYEVKPSGVEGVLVECEEPFWGFPDCPPLLPTSDLAVALRVIDIEEIGDKVTFYLRATASGGDGTYLFAWDGASRISATDSTNPNVAKRTILRSQTAVVTVSVTSDGENVEESITLDGRRIP